MDKKTKSISIGQLIEDLGSTEGMKRKKARKKLVAKGDQSIEALTKLVNHSKPIYRHEALKSLEEIGSPQSIPVFIRALEDDSSEVRWIAAKGLIKAGKKSLQPLLELILDKSDSVFVLSGAHHVIYALKEKDELPENFQADKMLPMLKNPGWEEPLKILAHQSLKTLGS